MTKKKKPNNIKRLIKKRGSIILFFIMAISFTLFNIFAKQTPLMMIEAQSRSVEYNLLNSDAGKILFQSPVMVKITPRSKPECLLGIFAPEELSSVSYIMFSKSLVIRAINNDKNPSAFFILKNNQNKRIELSSQSSLVYGPQSNCQDVNQPLRLPIWGEAEMGNTPIAPTIAGTIDPFSGLLLDGNVSLFGKNIFGSGLYPAGEFKLPVGAKLSSSDSNPWYGYATYVEDSGNNAISYMSVSASTQSDTLNLDRLASGSKTEIIQTSFLTQLTNDPFVASLGLLLAGLFFLSEFMLSLKQLWKNDEN